MRYFILCILISILVLSAKSQVIPFGYNVKLSAVSFTNAPGLHSFAFAQFDGKWLIIGGRKDGLHARQPNFSFPAANNNTDIYVIDINTKQVWLSSVNSLSVSLKEQLQATNSNFYQDKDTLYIIGGYGYSSTAVDHITYPYLTSINVSELINAIINNQSISPYFKQIQDQKFAVTGAQLGKIDSTFYLVGGHRFDGRYNPMGNPTYVQTYVDGIRKFRINNFGTQLSINSYSEIIDQVHLHRRDYNLIPQIFPNGEFGYMISSGVFQIGVDLPFLYPVDIKKSGHTPNTSFSQYLSNYHSAKVALYDSVQNTMHSVFFGGMSQYSYVNNLLTQDNNVPFVKTISRVSRDANGMLQENVFPVEMPNLIGASAEFIPNHQIPYYDSEIVKLSSLNGDSILIGHIYGGIYSLQANPFTANSTGATSASNVVYEVWLKKDQLMGIIPLNGGNKFSLNVFPNPSKSKLKVSINAQYDASIDLYVTNVKGHIVAESRMGKIF